MTAAGPIRLRNCTEDIRRHDRQAAPFLWQSHRLVADNFNSFRSCGLRERLGLTVIVRAGPVRPLRHEGRSRQIKAPLGRPVKLEQRHRHGCRLAAQSFTVSAK